MGKKSVYGDLKQFHIKSVVAAFNIEKPSLLTSSDHFISKEIAMWNKNTFYFCLKTSSLQQFFLESTTLTESHGYTYHSGTKRLVDVSAASYTVCWGVSAEQGIGRSSLPFDLHLSSLHRCNTAASWEMGGGDWGAGEASRHWPRQHIRGVRSIDYPASSSSSPQRMQFRRMRGERGGEGYCPGWPRPTKQKSIPVSFWCGWWRDRWVEESRLSVGRLNSCESVSALALCSQIGSFNISCSQINIKGRFILNEIWLTFSKKQGRNSLEPLISSILQPW